MNTTSAEVGGRPRRGGLLLTFVLVFCVLLSAGILASGGIGS